MLAHIDRLLFAISSLDVQPGDMFLAVGFGKLSISNLGLIIDVDTLVFKQLQCGQHERIKVGVLGTLHWGHVVEIGHRMEEQMHVPFKLYSAVPLMKGKRGSPHIPIVGSKHLRGEHIGDLLLPYHPFRHHHQLRHVEHVSLAQTEMKSVVLPHTVKDEPDLGVNAAFVPMFVVVIESGLAWVLNGGN